MRVQPIKQAEITKASCKNIVDSCFYLEKLEKFTNQLRYKELDKEKILADERLGKLYGMFNLLQSFDDAHDPETLKKMFIYQDHLNKEYAQEARDVQKEYYKAVIDPNREVAKIEKKPRKKKKIVVSGV